MNVFEVNSAANYCCLSDNGESPFVFFVSFCSFSRKNVKSIEIFDVYKGQLLKYFDLEFMDLSADWSYLNQGFGLLGNSFIVPKDCTGKVYVFDQEKNQFKNGLTKKIKINGIKKNYRTVIRITGKLTKFNIFKELKNSGKRKKFVSQKMVGIILFTEKEMNVNCYKQGEKQIMSAQKYFWEKEMNKS